MSAKDIKVDSKMLSKKILIGIQQLDNGEGTDFGEFLKDQKLRKHRDFGSADGFFTMRNDFNKPLKDFKEI